MESELSLIASAAPISTTKLRAAALRALNAGASREEALQRARNLARAAGDPNAPCTDRDLLRG
jgi:hypothetical protein